MNKLVSVFQLRDPLHQAWCRQAMPAVVYPPSGLHRDQLVPANMNAAFHCHHDTHLLRFHRARYEHLCTRDTLIRRHQHSCIATIGSKADAGKFILLVTVCGEWIAAASDLLMHASVAAVACKCHAASPCGMRRLQPSASQTNVAYGCEHVQVLCTYASC